MNKSEHPHRLTLLVALFLIIGVFSQPSPVQAQAGTPSEMLLEINNLRVSSGLAPMKVNNYLMLSAQNHADWIAATGQGGHVGEGGSSATDRAHAVGYPGPLVTENWARGPGLTVTKCIYDSWNDDAHMDNMLDPGRKEFGAGVALDAQGFTVYVVNFSKYDTGGENLPSVTPGGPTITPAPIIQPLTAATPQADGSIIHVVQYGQTLWAIADIYGVPLADILALNNLTADSAIYPDERLLIVAGSGETPSGSQTPATPPAVTATRAPSATPTPTPTLMRTSTPTPTPTPRVSILRNIFSGDTLWVGIGLVGVSVFGIALLLFTSSRLK